MEINVMASGSTGNAYRVSDGTTSLLLDAGIPIKRIQAGLQYRVTSLQGCLVTHCHLDHSKAAKDLARLGVDVYTSEGTIDAMGLEGHRFKTVKSLQEVTIGSFKVLPFDVQHDAPEPLGFLLSSTKTGEKLLYFTDTYYLKYKFCGLTHIMAECNYDMESMRRSVEAGYIPPELAPRIIKSHMSLEHLMDMLRANDLSKVRQIYLLHLSDNNSNEARYCEAIQKLTGAEVYVC